MRMRPVGISHFLLRLPRRPLAVSQAYLPHGIPPRRLPQRVQTALPLVAKLSTLKHWVNYDSVYQIARWTLPTAIVPTIRYCFIDPKEKRDTYRARDLTNFVLGALVFWGTKKIALPLLQRTQLVTLTLPKGQRLSQEAYQKALLQAQEFIAYAVAVTAQVLNNGIAAVKVSRWFEAHHQKRPLASVGSEFSSTPVSPSPVLSPSFNGVNVQPAQCTQSLRTFPAMSHPPSHASELPPVNHPLRTFPPKAHPYLLVPSSPHTTKPPSLKSP